MKVPFVDLSLQYQELKPEIENVLEEVFTSSHFIKGKQTENFKLIIKKLFNVKHVIPVGNGTDALFISLKCLGLKKGDEVITTAFSWISTSETISLTGATPVFVDVDDDNLIDLALLENSITENTKAILPVHLYGKACNLQELKKICDKHKLELIEDCAQSFLAESNGILTGTMGLAGTFSFYPSKNLGAYGDAGCIITNHDNFAEKVKRFANHGALKKHDHSTEGVNSRIDEIQAGILNIKLNYIEKWTQKRINIASYYSKLLSEIKQIKTLPRSSSRDRHVFHLYVIECENRKELMTFLSNHGIETSIHYPVALPFLKAYAKYNFPKNIYKNAYQKQKNILSLPMFPELTIKQIEWVCSKIKAFYSKQ